MAVTEWSTINVGSLGGTTTQINDDLIIYVATTGSDSTGDGTYSKPFATPNKALDWLKNKQILNEAYVTIKCLAGIYNLNTIYVNHPQGGQIILTGEEPEVYNIKGTRGVTFDFTTNTHLMTLIVSTAGEHETASHAGWTSEHNLSTDDIDNSYILIFNRTMKDDPVYSLATKHFYGSLRDNNGKNGLFSWGNGYGSTAGTQWCRIAGVAKITGVVGAKADGTNISSGIDKAHIQIEKYVAGSTWEINEIWDDRYLPTMSNRPNRRYYNDITERATETVGRWTGYQNGGVGLLAEYGGHTLSGHTLSADMNYSSTEMRIEGRVLKTIFNMQQSVGIDIHDHSSLGQISNLIIKGSVNSESGRGIRVSKNSSLGLTSDDYNFNTSKSKNIGIVGYSYGIECAESSYCDIKECAVNAARIDGEHIGIYGFLVGKGSHMNSNLCIAHGFKTGFYSADSSNMFCRNSVATQYSLLFGTIKYEEYWNNDDPAVGYVRVNKGDLVRQVGESGAVLMTGVAWSVGAAQHRIHVTITSGNCYFPNYSETHGTLEVYNSDTESWDNGIPGQYITSATNFRHGNGFLAGEGSQMTCSYSIATGLGHVGFYAAGNAGMNANWSIASECLHSGYRVHNGYLYAQAGSSFRNGRGYYSSGGQVSEIHCPFSMTVNNVRNNYIADHGMINAGHSKSFEGFDKVLGNHAYALGSGTVRGDFERQGAAYNASAADGGRGSANRMQHVGDIKFPDHWELAPDGVMYDGTTWRPFNANIVVVWPGENTSTSHYNLFHDYNDATSTQINYDSDSP